MSLTKKTKGICTAPIRVLVTGSRAKSSLTRLLHAGFSACGLKTYARITGVLPRELSPDGERVIRRCSPADVHEMGWWLRQLPCGADAVVMENSAVAPELQGFAAELLAPTLVVWGTLRPDHEEVWGPNREGAARSLMHGVPRGAPVAVGHELDFVAMRELFRANGNEVFTAQPSADHNAANIALALLACSLCTPESARERAEAAMWSLTPDIADFRVIPLAGGELAAAFSANDTASTEMLWQETGWRAEETTLLYHHRPDRRARMQDFLPWIKSRRWREIVFTRSIRPFLLPGWGVKDMQWHDEINSPDAFRRWADGRGQVFACGNVAGWPLRLLSGVTR